MQCIVVLWRSIEAPLRLAVNAPANDALVAEFSSADLLGMLNQLSAGESASHVRYTRLADGCRMCSICLVSYLRLIGAPFFAFNDVW